MHCARCNRPMSAPAVQITTRSGARSYGPTCARKMGLMDAVHRAIKQAQRVRVAGRADPDQLALELVP